MPRRPNYRGQTVVFPLGVVLLAAAFISLAVGFSPWLVFLCGVGCLGLIDDLADASPRGWRGHGLAVARGELSTGAVKAAGTLGLAIYATAGLEFGPLERLVDVAVLALAANAGNLLDLRPGRAEKALFLVLLGLCIAERSLAPLGQLGIFLGAVLVGAWFTLRERAMLGDTGASMIGAAIGISLATTLPGPGRVVALGVLVALTIYGEFRSISSAIDRLPLLKHLDSLGRVN